MDITVKDSNGAALVKNIRLTEDEEEVECNVEKVKGLVLKTRFLKKA